MTRPATRMPRDQNGVWETVRRVLVRLVSSVRVRDLPAALLIPPPAAVVPEALARPALTGGTWEGHWRPEAQTALAPLPQVLPGTGGTALTPLASVVSLKSALTLAGGTAHAAPMPSTVCTIHRLAGADAQALSPAVHLASVTPPSGAVRNPVVCFVSPGMARLSCDVPVLPREARRSRPGRRSAPDDLLSLAGGRVCSALAVAAGVPLTRRRRPAPPGVGTAEAFASERQRLAQAVGVAEDDAVLLGVFPKVPVAAVRRLALEEGGALTLWLKPEALAAAAAGRAPRLVTLIIGRQRSTGKMIQTAA